MPRNRPRPFTLGDLMALIAASAFGFALARWATTPIKVPPGVNEFSYTSMTPGSWPDALWLSTPGCYAATWTLALIGLRWRRPRPPAARVIRQPGAVACLAAVGALLVGGGLAVAGTSLTRYEGAGGLQFMNFENNYFWGSAIVPTSLSVAGAWLALALGGRWSPERSWIDRLGIALGIYWFSRYPVGQFSVLLEYLAPYPR